MEAHNSGKGAKYTRSRYPVTLVYYEAHMTKEEAMSREWHIKQLTREQKRRLIMESFPDGVDMGKIGKEQDANWKIQKTGFLKMLLDEMKIYLNLTIMENDI